MKQASRGDDLGGATVTPANLSVANERSGVSGSSVADIAYVGAIEIKATERHGSVADDLETPAGQAEIISCATLSNEPLIKFEWLRSGTHLDLIGSFTPHMREADNACFVNGSVYIDLPDSLSDK